MHTRATQCTRVYNGNPLTGPRLEIRAVSMLTKDKQTRYTNYTRAQQTRTLSFQIIQ
jgi:hypothetical protein